MNRKRFLGTLLGAPLAAGIRLYAAGPSIQVFKTPTCGCCGIWVQHLKTNGFQVTVQDIADTTPVRKKARIPESMASCHTGMVEGYAVEGHVPAADIQRMLREKPKAIGLAVPGMPIGSPGMESDHSDAYSVMLVDMAGKATVYKRYPAK